MVEIAKWNNVSKMVTLGSGANREVENYMFTCYARYKIYMNVERVMLGQRGMKLENLPTSEDIKKLEHRVKREDKKIIDNMAYSPYYIQRRLNDRI